MGELKLKQSYIKEQKRKEENKDAPSRRILGRINRKYYLLSLFIIVLFIVLGSFWVYRFTTSTLFDIESSNYSVQILLIGRFLMLPLVIMRWHDLGFPGWMVIFYLLPLFVADPIHFFLSVIYDTLLNLYLLFKPGEKEDNKFGRVIPDDAGYVDVLFNRY